MDRDAEAQDGVLLGAQKISKKRRRRTPPAAVVPDLREGLPRAAGCRRQEQKEGRPHRCRGDGADPAVPRDMDKRNQDLPCILYPLRVRDPALITLGKMTNTCDGVEEEKEHRCLKTDAVDGCTFDLEEGWDHSSCRPPCPGKPSELSCGACPTDC